MTERRYTLAEIDEMRKSLFNRRIRRLHDGVHFGDPIEDARRAAEDELRTAMIGGVDPAEVLALARGGRSNG